MSRKDNIKWFEDNISPVLKDVTSILAKNGDSRNLDLDIAEWWGVFIEETMALFELITVVNGTREYCMCMRSLMEISADINFMANYPENIITIQKRLHKFIESASEFSYKEIAEESRKYRLYKYKNNKRSGESIGTVERIEIAFDEDMQSMYHYLNCFTHFNIIGFRIDLHLRQSSGGDVISERLHLLKAYPIIFEKCVRSIGILYVIKELKEYNSNILNQVIENMPRQWSIEGIN